MYYNEVGTELTNRKQVKQQIEAIFIVSFESKQMKCPICNDDIPTADLRSHLTAMQHDMDRDVAKCIVYLLERLEKLEKK